MKLISLAPLLLAASLLPSVSKAADSTMTMTATVNASPCTLDSADSKTTIDLGNYYADELVNPGSGVGVLYFKLVLKDCPETTSKVIATFQGTDNPDEGNGKSFASTGSAENAGIQLKYSQSGLWENDALHNGSTMTSNVASDHTAQFLLATRVFTPVGNATPGTVHSTITVNFTKQ